MRAVEPVLRGDNRWSGAMRGRPRLDPKKLVRRPFVDVVLVVAVVGLMIAAYAVAGQPWSLDLGRPVPVLQTSVVATPPGVG
jgi:hypothetical protein